MCAVFVLIFEMLSSTQLDRRSLSATPTWARLPLRVDLGPLLVSSGVVASTYGRLIWWFWAINGQGNFSAPLEVSGMLEPFIHLNHLATNHPSPRYLNLINLIIYLFYH
jgi:hypothetical protein